jgi:hypothetical protein
MINEVYKTCQAILNKNNFGFLAPSDLNLYAHQAQLDIFENYISKYNKQINAENARMSGTGYAGLGQKIQEDLENFSTTNFLSNSSNNVFFLPSLTTTGDTWFMMNKIVCYPTQLDSGTATSTVANQLVDSSGLFVTDGIAVGDIVTNTTDDTTARVVTVTSETVLVLDADIFVSGETYKIFQASTPRIAEKVSHSKITELSISLLTTPNNLFPAYTLEGATIKVLPTTLNTTGMVEGQYFRYPASPKFTYVVIDGSPIFNGSASDYQDFELPQEEMPNLITRILKMAGLEIREAEVVQFANIEEQKENQQ